MSGHDQLARVTKDLKVALAFSADLERRLAEAQGKLEALRAWSRAVGGFQEVDRILGEGE